MLQSVCYLNIQIQEILSVNIVTRDNGSKANFKKAHVKMSKVFGLKGKVKCG